MAVMEEGISTISGLLTHRLGAFPKEDDSLPVGQFKLGVVETAGPKVELVRITRLKAKQSNGEND